MVNIPLFAGFHTSQVVVWDFFHQQYDILWKGKDTEVSLWSLKFLDSLWLALQKARRSLFRAGADFQSSSVLRSHVFILYHSLKVTRTSLNTHKTFTTCSWQQFTPRKFNIAPEKWWLEDNFPFQKAYFQWLCSISGVYQLIHFVGPPTPYGTFPKPHKPGGRASVASWRFGSRC